MSKKKTPAAPARERLQQALLELLQKRAYDAIRIQAIVDQAGVGRTTFYLYFRSKDELFMSCHEAMVGQFNFGPHLAGSREEILAPDVPPGLRWAYQHLAEARPVLGPILRGKEGLTILRLMREQSAQAIEASLRTAFGDVDDIIPFGMLANYLAGAQVGLVQWWLEKRPPYAADQLAEAFHRLQRAAVCAAFGIKVVE